MEALNHAPERPQRVHVGVFVRPFLGAVIDRTVVVAERLENAIRAPFVAADARPARHLCHDLGDHGLARGIGHHAGIEFPATPKDAEQDRLACNAAPTLTTDIGPIDLDMARQGRLAVNCAHVSTDFMRHAEGGRVGNAELALQFFGRNAVPRRGENEHRIEPLLQRDMRAVERCADHRVNVMAAGRARIGRRRLDAHKPAFLAALRAFQRFAVTQFHKVVQAGVVVGKLLKELGDGRAVRHICLRCLDR